MTIIKKKDQSSFLSIAYLHSCFTSKLLLKMSIISLKSENIDVPPPFLCLCVAIDIRYSTLNWSSPALLYEARQLSILYTMGF